MNFKRFGVLLCMSSGGCLSLESLKKYVLLIKKIGYNTLEIVFDDTIKIVEEPYYGYLMGGYTVSELQELDEFAYSNGITIIPSIQTLGHLDRLVKVPCYGGIHDIFNIIQADNEETYSLLDHLFATLRKAFKSDLVSIGFDEAFWVGRGWYLNRHGYVDKYEILFRHLSKVSEIAKSHNLKCMMWHDLFFSFEYGFGNTSIKDAKLPKEVLSKVPEGMTINYWEYFSQDKSMYDSMFKTLKCFNRDIWFTSTIFTCRGFAPHFNLCLEANKQALLSCKDNGIENYIVSLWSDSNNDCSYFTPIAALYTIKQYSLGNFDEDKIRKGFKDLFGYDYDDFMALQLPNKTPSNPDISKIHCQTKVSLYNDVLLGLRDNVYEKEGKPDYISYANKLMEISKRVGEYSYIFEKEAALCKVLDIKYDLGIRLRKAYKENNKAELSSIVDQISECVRRLDDFRNVFRKEWYKEFKAHGWDIQEYRIGGLRARLLGARESVLDYLNGNLSKIDELEESLLDFGSFYGEYNDFYATISLRGI